MARLTFHNRVTALTGINDSTNIAQYMYDGLSDTVKHVLKKMPTDLDQFTITEEFTEAPFTISSGIIASLKRKAGTFTNDKGVTVDDYRAASKGSISSFTRTQDTSSLLYQSKFNPVYVIDKPLNTHKGHVSIDVSPSISSDESVKVTYVDMVPLGSKDGQAYEELNPSLHTYLGNVPDQYLHIIMLYTGMKVLQRKLGSLILDDEDIELEESLRSRNSDLLKEYREYLGLSEAPPQQAQQSRRR
jgi:hypothetical protein